MNPAKIFFIFADKLFAPGRTEEGWTGAPCYLEGLQIATLTTLYPNPAQPRLGLFVRARLQHLGAIAKVRVVAPLARVAYSRLRGGKAGAGAGGEDWLMDGTLQVCRPYWLYPPMGGVLNAWFLYRQVLPVFRRLQRESKLDLIDAEFGFPDGIAAALLARTLGVPFTVTLRGAEVDHARARWRGAALGWCFRRARRVIAVSERLRDFAVSRGASPERTITIPNGVDASIYHPRDREAIRLKKAVPREAKVILTAGHLIELKGHHFAIRAAARLRERGLPVRLLIAGGPGHAASFEADLRRMAAGAGDMVTFLGEVPQQVLAEWMCAADLFCLASRREGWPNVVNEALACGTPVVAANVGAVPEMIVSEDYGVIVPPEDEQALAAGLEKALAREWDRSGISRLGQARGWPEVAAEVLRAMHEV